MQRAIPTVTRYQYPKLGVIMAVVKPCSTNPAFFEPVNPIAKAAAELADSKVLSVQNLNSLQKAGIQTYIQRDLPHTLEVIA